MENMENKGKSVWEVLSAIDCTEYIKVKDQKTNKLKYLSWAWAWGLVNSKFEDCNYSVYKFDGKPYLFDENLGYLVETSVTINGKTIPMQLPVIDSKNKAQKNVPYKYKTRFGEEEVTAATMFDINTAIMRCLTKNIAMFGLGHYIYAGEDLPNDYSEQEKEEIKIQEQEKEEIKIQEYKNAINNCNSQTDLLQLWNEIGNVFHEKLKPSFSNRQQEIKNKLIQNQQEIENKLMQNQQEIENKLIQNQS